MPDSNDPPPVDLSKRWTQHLREQANTPRNLRIRAAEKGPKQQKSTTIRIHTGNAKVFILQSRDAQSITTTNQSKCPYSSPIDLTQGLEISRLLTLTAGTHRADLENIAKTGAEASAPASAERGAQEVRVFEIPAFIGKSSTKALGDYGARNNFIREEFAVRLGLRINRDLIRKVVVGSGKQVMTTGLVTASFRFEGEDDVHDLKFHLLPNCIHDVILGKPFLKLTETLSNLSNFCRRVKERVVRGISQFHLLYLGAFGPKFEGSVNGQSQVALADSGSKVLVMDEQYAQSIGLPIQTGYEHRTTLRFADNSTAETSGMTYGVEWRFGCDNERTSPYKLNFHILKNAPANVILCDIFLYDTEAFSRYNHYLIDDDDDYEDEEHESHCYAIDIAKSKKGVQTSAIASSATHLQYLELVHRGEEEDRIAALPANEQIAAKAIEDQRRIEWDRTFVALSANTLMQSPQQTFSPANSQLPSIQSANSSNTNSQNCSSNRASKKDFWKRLIGLKNSK